MRKIALCVAFSLPLIVANSGFASDAGSADVTRSAPPLRITQTQIQGGSGLTTPPKHTKAGSATCSPAGTALCSAFETACGLVGGGMSSSPDGGVTCSVAKSKAHGLAARHVNEVLRLRAHPTAAQSEVATCRSDGSDDGNAICAGFGLGCIKLGCGPSSEPDGGVTCTC